VRHDSDNTQKDGENRRQHADLLPERVAALDFSVNFQFSHKGESILNYVHDEHHKWMRRALELAREAEEAGEIPVGCVIVVEGEIIGQGRNSPIDLLDPTAHAEMLALRQASIAAANYRLTEATLYATLEPCPMCAGALVAARVRTLVFGARDLRFGGVRSKFQIADSPLLNHRVEIVEGILGAESTAMLQRFFKDKRP
jgi:tRNA(adenine34) deaminase